MDLTTLSYLMLLFVGILGVDIATHRPDVILEAQASGTFDKSTINTELVNDIMTNEVQRIAATPSVMTQPVIRVGRLEGFTMSLAEVLRLQSVAYALQAQFGSRPDEIKINLFGEGGMAKVLVTGVGQRKMASFRQQIVQEPNETIVDLVQRAVIVGMSHIDPYITALSEVQTHAEDKDFTRAETIIRFGMAALPPAPISFERSLFENLNGIIALFRNDASEAYQWFVRAEDSCPDGTVADVVASLNVAFADLQVDRDREAAEHIEWLLRQKPPADKVLLSTAYMTLAAAQLGTQDVNGADTTIAKAIEAYPDASSAYDLWSDIKREKGDPAEAARLHRKALENSVKFENYSEIAALYFRLAWRENQPVMRSPFSNPDTVPLSATPHKP